MSFIEFLFRRDPAADWTANNPILGEGELGLETDTGKYKVGDGVTDWVTLTYKGIGSSGYSGYSGLGVSGFSGYSSPGTSGFSGFSAASPGPSGFSGFSGKSGYSGYSGIGESGFSGFSGEGVSGFSGYSSQSGFSGFSSLSGYSGYSGYSGSSGYSGYSGSGLSGYSGFSGSGISGFSGFSSLSGFSGYSGFSGLSGYSGFSGSGLSGYSGFSGAAGSTGVDGASGFSGFSGKSGYSGYSGYSAYSGFSAYSGYSGPQLLTFSTQTDVDYTLVAGDANTGVNMTSASAHVLTVPTNASVPFAVGTQIPIEQGGAGIVTITPAGGVTVNGATATTGQYTVVVLIKQATNTWLAAQGISGYSGFSGISGFSGFSGKSGYSGYSGYSGQSGYSGYSGYSGQSGYSGYSGANPGASGYSGYSGQSGYSGYSGYSAFSGYSGANALFGPVAHGGTTITQQSLTNITGLTVPLVSGTYTWRAFITGNKATGTNGAQFGVQYSGTSTSVDGMVVGQTAAAAAFTVTLITALNTATATYMTTSASKCMVMMWGTIVTTGSGNLTIQGLAVTSQTLTIDAGSHLEAFKTA